MSLFDSASLVVTPNGTKASKLYSIIPTDGSGDLTVTRATTSTRVNSSGLVATVSNNVPRLDYTGSTCPSILVEPQRTNLLTYSDQINNAAWTNVRGVVTPNTTISPDGTQNADTFVSAAGQSFFPALTRTPSFVGNTNYSLSIFAKVLGNTNVFRMSYVDNVTGFTGGSASFNLSTQAITIVQSPNSSVTATMQSVGNGWYRLVLNFLTIATPTFNYSSFDITTNDVGNAFALYGGQLEVGTYPTSYIPTVASAVTRNADVISKTGISSLIGQTEGAVFLDINLNLSFTEADMRFITISDGSSANWYFIGTNNANEIRFYFRVGATTYVSQYVTLTSGRHKLAFAYKNNDYVAYVDGVQIYSTTSLAVGSPTSFDLGKSFGSSSVSKQFINTAALWKTRLTNTELATLTTI